MPQGRSQGRRREKKKGLLTAIIEKIKERYGTNFTEMAAARYEQNDDFFARLFHDTDMMKQVIETVGVILYERLRKH